VLNLLYPSRTRVVLSILKTENVHFGGGEFFCVRVKPYAVWCIHPGEAPARSREARSKAAAQVRALVAINLSYREHCRPSRSPCSTSSVREHAVRFLDGYADILREE
jgi:hypothetical protein